MLRPFTLHKMAPLTKSPTLKSNKEKFELSVRLRDTEEMFIVFNCYKDMTMNKLKTAIELIAGIPTDFQRLSYLDKGDLMDETTIRFNDIVAGTTVTLAIWPYNGWPDLVKAAVSGEIQRLQSEVFKPDSRHCGVDVNPQWLSHRLFSALFISAHRGHLASLRFLIQKGADVGGRTKMGRGPLHAAAVEGRLNCLRDLYEAGAPLSLRDCDGHTVLDVASLHDQTRTVQQIFLLQWQQRAANVLVKQHLHPSELFAHQRFDSSLRTWHHGPYAQMYMAELRQRFNHQPQENARQTLKQNSSQNCERTLNGKRTTRFPVFHSTIT